MILRTVRSLAAAVLLLAGMAAHAAITCSVSSGGFAAAYDPASPATNVTQTSFTVSCTRGLAGDPSSVGYSVTIDNGLSPQGQNNRASYLANRIRYDTYKDGACVTKWKIPATGANTPAATNMNPSWLTVEYAKTFFRSNCRSAIDAAKIAVNAPTTAIVAIAARFP